MTEPARVPSTFLARRTGDPRPVPLTVRDGFDADAMRDLVSAIRAVRWDTLWHAYGVAEDVGSQLVAAALGDEQTRKAAWWELFGNIHHQGTIYEATVPAVAIIGRLAAWRDYPDRVEALAFLTAVAQAEGVVVWRYDEDGRLVYDNERQESLGRDVRAEMRELSASLLRSWRDEQDEVKRALLLLLAHTPALQAEHRGMVEELLPDRFTEAWAAIQSGADSQDAFDEVDAFERWVYGDGA